MQEVGKGGRRSLSRRRESQTLTRGDLGRQAGQRFRPENADIFLDKCYRLRNPFFPCMSNSV